MKKIHLNINQYVKKYPRQHPVCPIYYVQVEEFVTRTVVHQQGTIQMFWLPLPTLQCRWIAGISSLKSSSSILTSLNHKRFQLAFAVE